MRKESALIKVGIHRLTVLHEVAELLVPDPAVLSLVVLHYPLYLITREVGTLATAQRETTDELGGGGLGFRLRHNL